MSSPPRAQPLLLNFFLFFFIALLIPPSFYHKPVEGLDSSWNIALHLAYKYHLRFGKDFIFTYGPLGILNTRHPISINLFVYLIFDLYLLGSLFHVMRKIFSEHFGTWILLFTFLSIVLVMYNTVDEWCYFLFIFYICCFIKDSSKTIYLVQAALFAIIGFYLKISLGMIGVFFFLIVISYAVIRRKINIRFYFLVLLSFIVSLWLIAKWLNVDLKGYIPASMQFINDYNDAMFKPMVSEEIKYLYASLFIIGIMIGWAVYRLIRSILEKKTFQNLDELFIYFIVGFSLFILFKSAFVRAEGHLSVFFKSASLFFIFLYLFRPANAGKRITALACWIVLIISFISVSMMPGNYHPFTRLGDFSFFSNKTGEISRYLGQIFYYNQAAAASDKLDSSGNELKNLIGNKTVDIMPSEISKIYFNGLRYNPRPVIQSYAAYDRWLDSLNCEKYLSPGAPDYVLLSISSIDDRYPFFDESQTKLALFSHYTMIGELNGDLILKKKSTVYNETKPQKTDAVNIKFGEEIHLKKSDNLQFARFFVDYSLWGKIKRFFFQPPVLTITFTLENGDTKTYRAVKPILAGGVILNKFVVSDQDLQIFLRSNGLLTTNVKKIRIGTEDRHSGFSDSIRMISTYYSFSNKTDSERLEDSISLSTLVVRYKPVVSDSSVMIQDSILFDIRDFDTYSPFIKVRGWAFRVNANNKNAHVNAVLKSWNNRYELPSSNESRQDLTEYFKREDIGNNGFYSIVSKSQLQPGDYQLGVSLSYPDSGKRWVHYFKDLHVLVRSNYNAEKLKAIDPASVKKDDLQFDIGQIDQNEDQINVDGWAFIKNADIRGSKINLILQDKENIYRINTDIIKRSDLVSYFNNPLLEYSGFSTIIPKSKLEKGNYTVGVEVICCEGKSHSIQFSNQKIDIEATR